MKRRNLIKYAEMAGFKNAEILLNSHDISDIVDVDRMECAAKIAKKINKQKVVAICKTINQSCVLNPNTDDIVFETCTVNDILTLICYLTGRITYGPNFNMNTVSLCCESCAKKNYGVYLNVISTDASSKLSNGIFRLTNRSCQMPIDILDKKVLRVEFGQDVYGITITIRISNNSVKSTWFINKMLYNEDMELQYRASSEKYSLDGKKLNIAIYELDAKLNDAGIPHDFWCDSNFHEYRISYPSRVGCIYSATSPRWVYDGIGDTSIELCKEPYMLIDDDESDDDDRNVITGLTVDETFAWIKKHFDQSSDNGKMRFEDYLRILQKPLNDINVHDDWTKEKLRIATIHVYGGKSYTESFSFGLDSRINNEFICNSILDRFPSLKNSHIINMHTNEKMGYLAVEILIDPWISEDI